MLRKTKERKNYKKMRQRKVYKVKMLLNMGGTVRELAMADDCAADRDGGCWRGRPRWRKIARPTAMADDCAADRDGG
jgi:hypothetical protein